MGGWSGNKNDEIITNLAVVDVIINELLEEKQHETRIFPEGSNETVSFIAGENANTFCPWVEILDNNMVELSSKFAAKGGHISVIIIEDVSVKDKCYIYEISYGSGKTTITRGRFIAGETNKLPAVQQSKVRAAGCPAGEKVYYRMKCETGSATAQISFRYHNHI